MTAQVTTIAQLNQVIAQVPHKIVRPAVRRACREALKPIQKRLKSELPRKTGTLRKAVKIRSIPRSRVRIGARIRIQIPKEKRGKKGYGYHVAQEFGWKIKSRYGKKRIEGTHQIERTADQMTSQTFDAYAHVARAEVESRAASFKG